VEVVQIDLSLVNLDFKSNIRSKNVVGDNFLAGLTHYYIIGVFLKLS
jgi:hypothetical protein